MTEIRIAVIDDIFEIAKMWMAMRDEILPIKIETDGLERERFIVLLISRIYDPAWIILIAEKEGNSVGFILGEIQVMEYTDIQSGFCESVYVKPEYRTNGIGPILVDNLYTRFKKAGCKFTEFVTNYSPRLIKRWQGKGWEPEQVSYRREV